MSAVVRFRIFVFAFLLAAVPPGAARVAAQGQGGLGEPRVMAMEIQPVLRNVDDMARALDRLYPPALKEAGMEGVAVVWIHVDELGRVRETRLKETSGHVAFDDAALKVAQLMSFEPARNGTSPLAVWIPMGINFRPQTGAAPSREERPESAQGGPTGGASGGAGNAAAANAADDSAAAVAAASAPMTARPGLRNAPDVRAALAEHYPPALRDAGIGGVVNVRLLIDEAGVVQRALVNESSGYDALDDAALRVANVMRFSPARNRDGAIPVWIGMDINFQVQ